MNNPLNFVLEIIQQYSLHLLQKLLNINTLWILRWTKLSYRKPCPLKSITMITRDRWVTEKNARSYDPKKYLNGRCTVVVCFFACTFITNEVFSLIKEENNQYNTLTSWHFCSNWTLTNSTSLVFLSSCIWTACTWVSHSAFLADTIRSICRINWKQSKVYDGIIIIVNREKKWPV